MEGPQRQLFVEEFLHLSTDNFQNKQQVFFGGGEIFFLLFLFVYLPMKVYESKDYHV